MFHRSDGVAGGAIRFTPRYVVVYKKAPPVIAMADSAEPECDEHRARLRALNDELMLLLESMRREREVSGTDAENTLPLLRVEIDGHFAKSRELASELLKHQQEHHCWPRVSSAS